MPESNNSEELKQQIDQARPLITKQVQYACRKHKHTSPEDVEDLTQQIIFRFLEDNCRRWKTYKPAKAKRDTWLWHIIRNEAIQFFQKQPTSEPLEEISEGQSCSAATQEEEFLTKEQQALLHKAIRELTPHDQQLADLKLNGATDVEVAQVMNIKPRSVQQEWYKIGIKLNRIVREIGGGKTCATMTNCEKYFR